MSKVIMVGCDLHDRNMLLKVAVGTSDPQQFSYENNKAGRGRMIHRLKSQAKKNKSSRIIFAYEASGAGYGLSDQLTEAGIECHVLSPTHLPKTPKSAKLKTDARDAQMILEQVRGYVLAGNDLPIVWTPPQRLRDDRELVRARVDVGDETTRVKLKIGSLLKRYELQVTHSGKWVREPQRAQPRPWVSKQVVARPSERCRFQVAACRARTHRRVVSASVDPRWTSKCFSRPIPYRFAVPRVATKAS